MLALSVFGPGIANGLIAGGPQLGAGAAVGTGLAVAGVGAAALGLAGAGAGVIGAAGRAAAGTARGGAALAGATTSAYRAGGVSGVAGAAGWAAISPLRRAAASLRESYAAGGRAVTGMSGAVPGTAAADTSRPPAWARRMRRSQTISQGITAAGNAIRSGDHPASGGGIDLSEGE